MTTSDREVVAALEHAIVQRIGEPRYHLWFARRTKLTWDEDGVTVGVPNLHFQEWLQRTFGGAVREAVADVFGGVLPVRFVIDAGLFREARQEQEAVAAPVLIEPEPLTVSLDKEPTPAPSAKPVPRSRGRKKAPEGPTLFDVSEPPCAPRGAQEPATRRGRRWRKLGDFVVGACNRVAHAAALAAVENPGEGGNPLVLYGPTGTGKTHLLEGIYVGLRRTHSEGRVLFITAEEFTNRFVQAMRFGKLAGFRRQFREADALLVDDIDFLASKKATAEEFLHTVDAFLTEGRPLVVTCDCHPRHDDDLGPELVDRLLGGAIWSVLPPDQTTRLDVLRAKAVGGPSVPVAVLELLASRLRGNVRELEGALHSLRHYSRVTGRPIDRSLAEEALADLLRHAVRVVTLADVDEAVCRVLRLERGSLQSKGRSWAVSHPRMLAICLARRHTSAAYSEIGTHFGGRNHSTAVAAEKKVRQWLQDDVELALGERRLRVREVVERVERQLLR